MKLPKKSKQYSGNSVALLVWATVINILVLIYIIQKLCTFIQSVIY